MFRRRNGRAIASSVVAATLLTACGAGDADDGGGASGNTTYNQAWLVDFSGPYADVYDELQAAREATNDWWNDQVGSDIGVQLSEELQLHPEQSTDAFVLHHPEAKYFNT